MKSIIYAGMRVSVKENMTRPRGFRRWLQVVVKRRDAETRIGYKGITDCLTVSNPPSVYIAKNSYHLWGMVPCPKGGKPISGLTRECGFGGFTGVLQMLHEVTGLLGLLRMSCWAVWGDDSILAGKEGIGRSRWQLGQFERDWDIRGLSD